MSLLFDRFQSYYHIIPRILQLYVALADLHRGIQQRDLQDSEVYASV